MQWLIPGKVWLISPTLEDDDNYQKTLNWAREFSPEPEKEAYTVALEFAKRKFELAVGHMDTLDKKADDLIRTSVTVAALLVGAIKALQVEVTV